MYAIIKTGGKQYKAEPGRFIDVEKLDAEVGAEVSFEALMVVDGDDVKVGSPVVDGVKVVGKVLAQDKAKKIIVYKYKAEKRLPPHAGPSSAVYKSGNHIHWLMPVFWKTCSSKK